MLFNVAAFSSFTRASSAAVSNALALKKFVARNIFLLLFLLRGGNFSAVRLNLWEKLLSLSFILCLPFDKKKKFMMSWYSLYWAFPSSDLKCSTLEIKTASFSSSSLFPSSKTLKHNCFKCRFCSRPYFNEGFFSFLRERRVWEQEGNRWPSRPVVLLPLLFGSLAEYTRARSFWPRFFKNLGMMFPQRLLLGKFGGRKRPTR
mmetsp:Transcript_19458/g.30506  ORF Transcript_19458/g.30506 Transcript_19458/m.30506 type:complete len:203 (-) Transcript_19458:4-612(-)